MGDAWSKALTNANTKVVVKTVSGVGTGCTMSFALNNFDEAFCSLKLAKQGSEYVPNDYIVGVT
jgi:hypothetical protein